MHTILAIDDEYSVRKSFEMILGDRYKVMMVEEAAAALELINTHHVDLILLDLTLPGMSGVEFLTRLKESGDATPVIVVTGSNSVQTAVTCMKHGASEFVVKPFDVGELGALIDRTFTEQCQRRELAVLRERDAAGFEHIVGESPVLMETLARARQAMHVGSTVLISGESGTGKDLLARAIHNGGQRKAGPFVPISCCAIPDQLVESELFGHVKGAFTGASEHRLGKMQAADGGTLFLDEIGEMPLEAQAKLLRVLQDGCFYPVGSAKAVNVDIRVICASNRDLPRAVSEGLFREDLYYRVNVVPIEMPPLRRRREDIHQLVRHFINKHAPHVNARCQAFSQQALGRMAIYRWPGNVRELENTVERVLVCHSGVRVIEPQHLEGLLPHSGPEPFTAFDEFEGLPIADATSHLERHLIHRALERTNYVQSQAAAYLGTTRRILKYKMDQLGLIVPDEPDSMAG
ncbi:MAG: sigma-54-dependent transcriptional regulator [Candidatus Hydrogenedentota bacterium]